MVRTLEPKLRLDHDCKKIQKILYDKVDGDTTDYVVGIVSSEVKYFPKIILSKYIAFTGGAVKAVNLNPESDERDHEFELMSE
jgi:hypothetical protein